MGNSNRQYTPQDIMKNADFQYTFGNYRFDKQADRIFECLSIAFDKIPQVGEYLSKLIDFIREKQLKEFDPEVIKTFNQLKNIVSKLEKISSKEQVLNYMDMVTIQYQLIQHYFIDLDVAIYKSFMGASMLQYYDQNRFELKFGFMLQFLIILKARKQFMGNDKFNTDEFQTKYYKYYQILEKLIQDIAEWRTKFYQISTGSSGNISYFDNNFVDQRITFIASGSVDEAMKYSRQLKSEVKLRLKEKYKLVPF